MQDAGALLDQAVLDELRAVLGDEFPVLVRTFITDGEMRISRMRAALAAGDAEALRESAHAFKGSSVNLGANGLSGLCRDVESLARAGDLAGVPPLLIAIDKAFAAAVTALG